MTTVYERVPMERVAERARRAHPGTTALRVLAWLLLNAGFAAARVCSGLWFALAYAGCAVAEGWREGRSPAWREAVRAREARRASGGRAGAR
jgi:hypothetical protein